MSTSVSSRSLALGAAVLALLALVLVSALWSSRPDLAYIDSSRLMQEYDGAIEARSQLQDRQRTWQQNVQTLQSEVQALGQRITQTSLSASKSKAVRDSLQQRQQQLARYQRVVQQKAQSLQTELMQPVYDQLNADLKRFGQQEGYDLLFGTVAGGNILFADDATDVTDSFLDYIGNDGPSGEEAGAALPDSSATAASGM